MTELQGEQVTLVTLAAEHAEALRAIRRHQEVANWWGPLEEDFPHDEPTAERWTVMLGEEVAGMIQCSEENEPDYRNAEIDVFLDADLRGLGIGPDVIRTLARHLTEDRGHHRLFLGVNIHNARAIRCYEKSGFRTVGTMRLAGRDYRTGKYEDEYLMEYVVEPRS